MGDGWQLAATFWVPLLTIVGGGFVYAWQRKTDRISELLRARQELYRAYLFSQQRVLTSCVRTDHEMRRAAIDEFRSVEAMLYVAAPHSVATRLAELHAAFFSYTRCVRCIYEPRHNQKFGDEYPPTRLLEFETEFEDKYQNMLRVMRADTLGRDDDIKVEISLASKEIHQ
jgi:hypothetical protein